MVANSRENAYVIKSVIVQENKYHAFKRAYINDDKKNKLNEGNIRNWERRLAI